MKISENKSTSHRHLVIFDQAISASSPAGSCVLAEIQGLKGEYEITVFSDKCDIVVQGGGVHWIRIPLPSKPILLRYLLFQILAPIYFLFWRLRGNRADLVQTTQGQYVGADVAYAHFCHKAYLSGPWQASTVSGLRRIARYLNHKFNAFFESRAFTQAQKIVVPSLGLARELSLAYPHCANRVFTIANPVDLERFQRPTGFDRVDFRMQYSIGESEVVFVFVALGDFARKGLGLIIDSLAIIPEDLQRQIKLLVVGGQEGEIKQFLDHAESKGLKGKLTFLGMQQSVEHFLWAADVFIFPSLYETFSLVIHQAAAASLPIIVTKNLYGAEDFVVNNHNGWYVDRSSVGLQDGIQRCMADRENLKSMGDKARLSILGYSTVKFQDRWRKFYSQLENK